MLVWQVRVTKKRKALVTLTTQETQGDSMFDSKFPFKALVDSVVFYQNYMPKTLVSVRD